MAALISVSIGVIAFFYPIKLESHRADLTHQLFYQKSSVPITPLCYGMMFSFSSFLPLFFSISFLYSVLSQRVYIYAVTPLVYVDFWNLQFFLHFAFALWYMPRTWAAWEVRTRQPITTKESADQTLQPMRVSTVHLFSERHAHSMWSDCLARYHVTMPPTFATCIYCHYRASA